MGVTLITLIFEKQISKAYIINMINMIKTLLKHQLYTIHYMPAVI